MTKFFSGASPNAKFLGTVFFTALAIGIAAASFAGLASAVLKSRNRFGDATEKLSILESKRAAARRTSLLLESRRAEVERVNRLLIDRERPIAFLEEMEGLAEAVRTVVTLDLVERKDLPKDTLLFRVTADGAKENVLRFLKLLEQMPYAIQVEEAEFQRLSAELVALSARERAIGSTEALTHRLILLIKVKTRPS